MAIAQRPVRREFTMWVAIGAVAATLAIVFVVRNASVGERHITRKLERLYSADDAQFARSMSVLLGPPIVDGNRIETLVNGLEIFPAMLAAIRQARRSITFETYIYWSGSIGQEFAQALADRARAGATVHVLLDWIGSMKMDGSLLQDMTDAGVQVARYHKPHWWRMAWLNNRTHRKLLVIDGEIGFTGGVGIADQWRGNAEDSEHWRDTHFRIEGPVVAQIQAAFLDNWIKSSGNVLHGERYFPKLQSRGEQAAQMFTSSPTGGTDSMLLMYLMAITAAQRSIYLANAYFVPDDLAISALVAARRRGVKVRIITPGPLIDSDVVRSASRARWGELIEAGVQIAEYEPTMFHVKSMVVDELLVSVGSTNFDNRSFRINDEANLNVFDAALALRQIEIFDADWKKSRPVTLDMWQRRPIREKLFEQMTSLLRSQL
jgi:cardiolipin synthase A/B